MRRLHWWLALLALVPACGVEPEADLPSGPAVVFAGDGTEIGAYVSGGLQGAEPELLALVAAELRSDDAFAQDDIALSSKGVVVATSLDLPLQQHLRSTLNGSLPPDGPHGGAIVLDRRSGAVKAIALSGHGEAADGMEVMIGSGRPTGSALKPLALAAALDAGLTLETTFPAPHCIALPDNPADETCGGTGNQESLLEATVASLNPVFVQLIASIGVAEFGSVVADAGITAGSEFRTVDSVLGTYPVSVLEMAGAFRTVAEGGSYVAPTAIAEVTVAGQTLSRPDRKAAQVLSPETWEQVDLALRAAVERGTGQAADPGFPVAGKTGTARGLTDAWFAGYTDELVAVVWIGFSDQPDQAMVFPAAPITVTGGTWPAQIWADIVSIEGSN